MRPFSNARRVNSPASAGRSPGNFPSAASSAAITARPPCTCSSAMSSPVSLLGAGNHSARPSSMTSVLAGSRTRTRLARRDAGTRPISCSSAKPARGPDTRITAIAARGRPEARARRVPRAAATAGSVPSRVSAATDRGDKRAYIYIRPSTHAWIEPMSSVATGTHENRLARETSPYLLQHKHNPVDWWPWGTEALAEAKRANKPILLSVGYAACHWCHVMAHESFEDAASAQVMNDLFVNIKVDREERPDVDQIYMAALHHLGEHGGWPLTMFLTPDGEPFWGGTYFPKTSRYGKPAFVDLLREVERVFRQEPQSIEQNRSALMARLAERARPKGRAVIAAPELD